MSGYRSKSAPFIAYATGVLVGSLAVAMVELIRGVDVAGFGYLFFFSFASFAVCIAIFGFSIDVGVRRWSSHPRRDAILLGALLIVAIAAWLTQPWRPFMPIGDPAERPPPGVREWIGWLMNIGVAGGIGLLVSTPMAWIAYPSDGD